jgi:hypothetical protein
MKKIILILIFLSLLCLGAVPIPIYPSLKLARIWRLEPCNWAYLKTRYDMMISTHCGGPGEKINIGYEIATQATGYNRDTDVSTGRLSELKTWVSTRWASYGFSSSEDAYEQCFLHLKSTVPAVTLTFMNTAGSQVIQPYNAANPKSSRIPGLWGINSDWMMDLKEKIYLDFWVSRSQNYTSKDGYYMDGWEWGRRGLDITQTREFASTTEYVTELTKWSTQLRAIMNAQGKYLGGNISAYGFPAYPFRDVVDIIYRENKLNYQSQAIGEKYEANSMADAEINAPGLMTVWNFSAPNLEDRYLMFGLTGFYIAKNSNAYFNPNYTAGGPEVWIAAYNYDIGTPTGTWYTWATGTVGGYPYEIMARQYTKALVLFKPRANWTVPVSFLGDDSMTTHSLGAGYRLLAANGTVGSPITTVSLRNIEGAILIPTIPGPIDTTSPVTPTGLRIK